MKEITTIRGLFDAFGAATEEDQHFINQEIYERLDSHFEKRYEIYQKLFEDVPPFKQPRTSFSFVGNEIFLDFNVNDIIVGESNLDEIDNFDFDHHEKEVRQMLSDYVKGQSSFCS